MKFRTVISTVAPVIVLCGAWLLPALLPPTAAAQTRPELTSPIPPDAAVTVQAKITAIDPATRRVTLAGRSGSPVTLTAGPDVRLEMLKVGDTVDAEYYRAAAFFVSPPGEKVPEDEVRQAISRSGEAPGGIGTQVTRVSGLVVGINLEADSVDLVSPQGGEVYTIHVMEPTRRAKLQTLKVGDTITAIVSEALAVSIQPSKS